MSIDKQNKIATPLNKTADIKEYMKEYRKKNIDKWTEKKECQLCKISYSSSNASNHIKSRKHQYALIVNENEKKSEENKKLQQIIDNNKKLQQIKDILSSIN